MQYDDCVTIFQSVILGIVQGLTEFLPISSSGHLVLLQEFFGLHIDARSLLGFDVILHAGTLLALLCCYGKRWMQMFTKLCRGDKAMRHLFFLLIIGTIPAGLAGVLLDDYIAKFFHTIPAVAAAFLATAGALWIGEHIVHRTPQHNDLGRLTVKKVLFIGVAQACALLPGISRSGLTISAAREVGLDRSTALDFSFLLAVPLLIGATLLTGIDIAKGSIELPDTSIILVGFLASAIVSGITVVLLRSFVQRHSLAWFGLYLVPLAFLLIFGA